MPASRRIAAAAAVEPQPEAQVSSGRRAVLAPGAWCSSPASTSPADEVRRTDRPGDQSPGVVGVEAGWTSASRSRYGRLSAAGCPGLGHGADPGRGSASDRMIGGAARRCLDRPRDVGDGPTKTVGGSEGDGSEAQCLRPRHTEPAGSLVLGQLFCQRRGPREVARGELRLGERRGAFPSAGRCPPAASAVAAAWVECRIAAAQSCSDQARSAISRSSMVSPWTRCAGSPAGDTPHSSGDTPSRRERNSMTSGVAARRPLSRCEM